MILQTSQTVTASGTGTATALHGGTVAAYALLVVSAAATVVGDTLNVYVQGSSDSGTTWDDIMAFTQVLGNGGAKKFSARWVAGMTPTTAQGAPQDAALAAGVNQGPAGLLWRAKWVVASSSAPSFTFAVHVTPMTARA